MLKTLFDGLLLGGDVFDVFDAGEAIRQQTVIHGLLICAGLLEPDAAISGKDALEMAEKYVHEQIGHLQGEEE